MHQLWYCVSQDNVERIEKCISTVMKRRCIARGSLLDPEFTCWPLLRCYIGITPNTGWLTHNAHGTTTGTNSFTVTCVVWLNLVILWWYHCPGGKRTTSPHQTKQKFPVRPQVVGSPLTWVEQDRDGYQLVPPPKLSPELGCFCRMGMQGLQFRKSVVPSLVVKVLVLIPCHWQISDSKLWFKQAFFPCHSMMWVWTLLSYSTGSWSCNAWVCSSIPKKDKQVIGASVFGHWDSYVGTND